MSAIAHRAERRETLAALLLVGALAALCAAVLLEISFASAIGITGLIAVVAWAVHKPHIPWRYILVSLLVVILFIPIRRYTMPGNLPFELEPYRVIVMLALLAWGLSLLVDSRVKLRRSGFEAPVGLIAFAALASTMVNPGRVGEFTTHVLKSLTFFTSFILVFFLIVSVVRAWVDVDAVVKMLVGGGAVVAAFAVIESRTAFSPFEQLDMFLPFLEKVREAELERGVRLRAFGPAEHPIALSAALVILLPLAIYLTRRSYLWWSAVLLIGLGALAGLSRTGVVMLLVMGITYFVLRPAQTRRLWPLLLPFLAAIHFALPGALGTLKQSFFPTGGVIAEQKGQAGSCSSSGRVADLGPTLDEAAQKPALGYGFGTRITTGVEGVEPNACILDNQWLGTLMETGLVGIAGWGWFFLRFIRRAGRAGRGDPSPRGWLLVSLTASVASFSVGMFLFDAFTFTQVTFLLWILLALGAAVLKNEEGAALRPV